MGSGLGAIERGAPRKSANLRLEFFCKPRHVIKEWFAFHMGSFVLLNFTHRKQFCYCCCYYYYFFFKQKPTAQLLPLPFRCDFSSPLYDTEESNRDIVALSPLSALLPQAVSLN